MLLLLLYCLSTWAMAGPPLADERLIVEVEPLPWMYLALDAPDAADPDLDTTDWVEIAPGTPWAQTSAGAPPDKVGWFRKRFEVPDDYPLGLALLFPTGAVEIYVDGEKAYEHGDFEGRVAGTWGVPHVHVEPAASADGELVVAIRMWSHSRPRWEGTVRNMAVGPALSIHHFAHSLSQGQWQDDNGVPRLFVGVLTLGIGLLHLALYWRRREPALLAFAGYGILKGGTNAYSAAMRMSVVVEGPLWHRLEDALHSLGWACLLIFAHLFFRSPYFRTAAAIVAVFVVGAFLALFHVDSGFNVPEIAAGLMGLLGIVVILRALWLKIPGARTIALGLTPLVFLAVTNLWQMAVGRVEWIADLRTLLDYGGQAALVLVISIALAERFAGTMDELDETYRASFRFVPLQFLKLLGRKNITEVSRGDNTSLDMTIMFCDIRGFTTLSEGRTPQRNFRFINQFLEVMEPSIHDHGGFVGQYLGDGFLALFPTGSSDPVRAAVEMQRSLEAFNRGQVEAGEKAIRIGIGLHSGNVMLGTIGGASRLDTGVVSDVVNTASRVEGLSKMYGAPVVISEATAATLEAGSEWTLQELDSVVVKGRKAPLRAFEVWDGEPSPEMRELKTGQSADYSAGLAAFRAGQMEEARRVFAALGDKRAATSLWVQRCDWFLEHGLPSDWDGVVRLTVK